MGLMAIICRPIRTGITRALSATTDTSARILASPPMPAPSWPISATLPAAPASAPCWCIICLPFPIVMPFLRLPNRSRLPRRSPYSAMSPWRLGISCSWTLRPATTRPEPGFTSRFPKGGKITNQGVQLSVNAKVLQTKKFSWNLLANWSLNRNKVVSLASGVDQLNLGTNLGVTIAAKKGLAYGTMIGNGPYKVGDTILVNSSNGRTIVDPNLVVGNFHPDWIGSIGSQFRYAGFDLSILFTAKWGGQIYSASYGRANFNGVTIASLYGRDAYLFSSLILGESGNEQQGIGQTVGTTPTAYADANRPKGAKYTNAYFARTNPDGSLMLDKNGRYIPGKASPIWMNPTTYESDMTLNNVPALTFNATSVKLSELILGYTFPQQLFGRVPIRALRLAFVGRNLWTLLKHTPQGIDPEAANNSGNAQGIEAGGSFPYATYGFDLKCTF